jgi:DNA-binding transcriptional ArsR family regulator
MPGSGFDELIPSEHAPVDRRAPRRRDWVDFAFVRDRLGMSDSALSKQLSILKEAALVAVERRLADRRGRMRVRLAPAGRAAFQGRVTALREIVAAGDPVAGSL